VKEIKTNINNDAIIQKTRRNFLNILVGSAAVSFIGMLVYPIIKYLTPPKLPQVVPDNVLAGEVSKLKDNSGKIFRFGNKPAILIRTPSGDIRAFTAICTHLQCTVQYRSDLKQIWCACHNGHYNLFGKNISGPPPRPLERYDVTIKGDDIYVHRNT
jgi:cytochrome b6-f complex iron-sulfur subunit